MKRKSMEGSACAIARALDVIGDWWSLLIIREALSGARRFGEYQRRLGVARNILTTRLKALVAQGILEAIPAPDGGAYQEYAPTEKGRALFPVIVALSQWGSEYLFEAGEKCSVVLDVERNRPLGKLQVRSEDGRILQAKDILVRPEIKPIGFTSR